MFSRKILTIAGSDCIGGAGIQADLKTILTLLQYGMSVVTAVTAQNTLGVQRIEPVSPETVAAQMDSVFSDIRPDAVKIGMVPTPELMEVVCDKLAEYRAEKIVVDPVMVSTSGGRLMEERALCVLKQRLIPMADVITPNIPEAEVLAGISIRSKEDMEEAARRIRREYRGAILVKGGHMEGRPDDLLMIEDKMIWIRGRWIDNPNTHGTGCTMSAAIATRLARGETMEDSVRLAKGYVTTAIYQQLDIGHGKGPILHNPGAVI